MKTPAFWKTKNLLSDLMLPLSWVYAQAGQFRLKLHKPQKVNAGVICVGNLTAGGSGKTPVAIELANMLIDYGKTPFFVSRGYGGKLKGVIVDEKKHLASDVGDEPLLLARAAKVSINPNRFSAAQKAVENGADVIIMDDGFQNPYLAKDLSFLVFDGNVGVGNARVIPAGALRESLKTGLPRADAAIIIGEDKTGLNSMLGDLPIFKAEMKSVSCPEIKLPVIAFAGIGRPEKFYNSLREMGINIAKTFDFPDHHSYSEKELHDLVDMAWKEDMELITTSKDFVKIPEELRHHFKVLEIKIVWEDKNAVLDFIRRKISI
ncbi:MAG: tetraacyldisaccharide 4'-kinase [Alphaproteobacteria bacterium]|nr:tetraacyldisaccharide 4'-kinase [Alphaproteobacteria bacterium]